VHTAVCSPRIVFAAQLIPDSSSASLLNLSMFSDLQKDLWELDLNLDTKRKELAALQDVYVAVEAKKLHCEHNADTARAVADHTRQMREEEVRSSPSLPWPLWHTPYLMLVVLHRPHLECCMYRLAMSWAGRLPEARTLAGLKLHSPGNPQWFLSRGFPSPCCRIRC